MSAPRVWKYAVPMPDRHCRAWVYLPNGAAPLSVGLQQDEMVLWALVPEDAWDGDSLDEHKHRLIVANTGAVIPELPEGVRFLGTVTFSNGIVWHVWDGDSGAAE